MRRTLLPLGLALSLVLVACDDKDSSGDSGAYYGSDDTGGSTYGEADDATEAPEEPEEAEDTGECADVTDEPTTVYLSADDSNSQAQPAFVRQLIRDGQKISGSPRLYEFLNYYTFDYEPAEAGTVRIVPQMRYDPEPEAYTLLIGVVAPDQPVAERRPLNLTFSVDTSGSMSGKPMNMSKAVMYSVAEDLREGDVVSMVTWDASTSIELDSLVVDGPDDPAFIDQIDALTTGGSTNLNQGLNVAYSLARENFAESRLNRVILLSDGGANTGVTEEELIAEAADDGEGEAIYLVGVGASDSAGYSDYLMDSVTDVGKGAYLFIDSTSEAQAMFSGERFVTNMELAARDVQLSVTLPGGYRIAKFHGEEMSTERTEVEPQHLAPNDAMLYHQILEDCDAESHDGSEMFEFTVAWGDPETREMMIETLSMSADELREGAQAELLKADAIIAYAQAVTGAASTANPGAEIAGALDAVREAQALLPGDADLAEIEELLLDYAELF